MFSYKPISNLLNSIHSDILQGYCKVYGVLAADATAVLRQIEVSMVEEASEMESGPSRLKKNYFMWCLTDNLKVYSVY